MSSPTEDLHRVAPLLTKALTSVGISSDTQGWEVIARVEHLVLAERSAGLVARIRIVGHQPPDGLSANLRTIADIAAAGGPVLPPAWPEPLSLGKGEQTLTATIWPLAHSRLFHPQEIADALHRLHDSPVSLDLRDWMDVCYGKVRSNARALSGLPCPPPQWLSDKCVDVADIAMAELQKLVGNAPNVVVHGDSHPSNFVEWDGRVVAIDLDRICQGPREADLAIPLMHSMFYPGAQRDAGERLTTAYYRPIDVRLLEAAVHARAVYKLVSLAERWDEPDARDSLLQREAALHSKEPFARLHGTEALCPVAP